MRKAGKPALPRAEHFAAPAQPQILLGDDEPVLGPAHHIEPLPCRLGQRLAVEQDAGGWFGAAPDPAAQLMQLRQAEALGMLDDHDRGIRHIDAHLDHRGRHQDGDFARGKRCHHAVLVLAREAPMHQPNFVAEALGKRRIARLGGGDIEHLRLGDQRADPIDLRAALDRACDAGNDLVEAFERHGARRDRLPPGRLLVEPRHVHVAIAGEQQGARDRRRRHHQQLGAAARALGLHRQALMHAEAMLLVDDHEAEIA